MQPATAAKSLDKSAREGKYLFFELAGEEFGIQVTQVREIMGLQNIAAVPQTPDYVKGVINLRGKAVPVVDLRRKFSLPAAEYTSRTCIIVVQAALDADSPVMGIVVDGVTEVVTVPSAEIEDTPKFGNEPPPACLIGIAKSKNKIRILMDIEGVLTSQELHGVTSLAA